MLTSTTMKIAAVAASLLLTNNGLVVYAAKDLGNAYPGGKGYDAAYIHTSCSLPSHPEFYDDAACNAKFNITTGCSLGEGWYCNDGEAVSEATTFDKALIHKDCSGGVHYLGGANFVGASTWYCIDDGPLGWVQQAYIHGDCSLPSFPQFSFDSDCGDSGCAFGKGYYCNDGQDVSGYKNPYDFDMAFISDGCCGDGIPQDGQCVEYYKDIGAWLCKDGGYDALINNKKDKSGKSSIWVWLGPVLAIVVIGAGAAVWFFFFRQTGVQEAVPVASTPIAHVKGDDAAEVSVSGGDSDSGEESSAQQAVPVVTAAVVADEV